MATKRDISIDIMRGLAIITMVAANMSAYILQMPPPALFRFYGTFAAPLFILLSGLMIALKGEAKEHDFPYYLQRGVLTLLVAASIDVFIWQTFPFINVDVLYLIGISLPLAYLFLQLNNFWRWATIALIIIIGPILRWTLGYSEYEVLLMRPFNLFSLKIDFVRICKNWLADGFFPIFPWLAFSFLGPVIQKIRLKSETHLGNKTAFLASLSTLIIGIILWIIYPGPLFIRENYSELFYFPTIGYIITSIGVILTFFSIVDWKPEIAIYRPIQALGECSLFIYILHLAIIRYFLSVFWPNQQFGVFVLIYIVFTAFLIAASYGIRALKGVWHDRPFLVKFLIG